MNKMTYVEALNIALDNLANTNINSEVIKKLEALRDAQMKRSNRGKATPSTKNDPFKSQILSILESTDEPMASKDIAERYNEVFTDEEKPMTSARVAGLMRSLIESGKVKSEEGKKRINYFSLVRA